MNISNGIDVPSRLNDTLCRVCLSSDEENKCIFTSHMTLRNRNSADLWEKLQFYGGIEVKQGDGLPSKMCEKCVINIRVAHDFRTQCQESDVKLRRLYRKVISDGCGNSAEGSGRLGVNLTLAGDAFDRAVKIRDEERPRGNEKAPTTRAKESTTSDDKSSSTEARKLELATSDDSNKEEPAKDASKRLIVFRRMTSMENLKNCKELQRRYVKKTKASRTNERDCEVARTKTKRNAVGRRPRSELAISSYERSRSCEGDKSSGEGQFGRAPDSRARREGKFDRSEFSTRVKSHVSKETFESASCKICNKNFRKFLTMVRHLHAHKSDNPGAVYAILRDIRERRRRDNSIFEYEDSASREAAQRNRLSNVRIESSSRLDKSSVNFSDSRKDANFATEAWNIESNGNETEHSDSSRAYDVTDESALPSDDRSAIKLINIWIREELNAENEDKRFICNICERSYVTEGSLLKHKSKIHDDPPGRDTCSQYSIDRDEILESRRRPEGTLAYRCKDCEKSYDSETRLAKHRKIHIRDKELEDKNFKRFLCHICSKTFRHNTGLIFHMRTHTGYKPHVCGYCGRGFTSNSNCTNHERTHTGDRPYVCHFCSAAFAKSCTLKAHITTHTGEANYHCKTCGKSFRRLKYLKEHCFTHTGEKPYACKICGTAYSHSGSLFVHEKKCKAQYDDCQAATTEGYADGRTLVRPTNLAIDPAILPIPNPDNVTSSVTENGSFVDDARRLDRASDNAHSSLPNGPTVRNFIALGQIFQA